MGRGIISSFFILTFINLKGNYSKSISFVKTNIYNFVDFNVVDCSEIVICLKNRFAKMEEILLSNFQEELQKNK